MWKNQILLLFFMTSFIWCHSQSKIVEKVVMKHVSENILTTYSIGCTEFENLFNKNQVKEKIITDSLKLNLLKIELGKIKFKKVKNGNLDVRAKYYIYYIKEDKPLILCKDKFGQVVINGRFIRNNKKLISILSAL